MSARADAGGKLDWAKWHMTRTPGPSQSDVETRRPCQNSDFPQNLSRSEDTSAKIVARNASFLMLGQVMSTVLAILFSSALGRTLGAADFGLYFMLVSFSTFAYVVIDWGQQVYVTREAARRPERGSVLLGTVLVLRISGAALVAVLSGLAVRALGYDAMTCWLTIAFIITTYDGTIAFLSALAMSKYVCALTRRI